MTRDDCVFLTFFNDVITCITSHHDAFFVTFFSVSYLTSVALFLPLSRLRTLTHTHTHTHTHTRTHTHTNTHTQTHIQHTHTHPNIHTYEQNTHTFTHTHKSYAHIHTHTRTHTHKPDKNSGTLSLRSPVICQTVQPSISLSTYLPIYPSVYLSVSSPSSYLFLVSLFPLVSSGARTDPWTIATAVLPRARALFELLLSPIRQVEAERVAIECSSKSCLLSSARSFVLSSSLPDV